MANKKLTLSAIRQEDAKKYSRIKQIFIDDYTLDIDVVFRPTKIRDLLIELVELVDYGNEKNIKISNDLIAEYYSLLIIKHFSSLEIPDEIEDRLRVIGILIDNDYIARILDNFDEDELNKVLVCLRQINENLAVALEELKNKNISIEEYVDSVIKDEDE